MAFVIQDPDNPTSDANAYISVAEFKAYHDDRGTTYTGADTVIEQAIVRATDYMDSRWTYKGTRYDSDQSTECPRAGAIQEGYAPNRLSLYISGLPVELKEACAEYAVLALAGSLLTIPSRDASGQRVIYIRKKVDVLEKEVRFQSGSRYSYPDYPLADAKMVKTQLLAMSRRQLTRG